MTVPTALDFGFSASLQFVDYWDIDLLSEYSCDDLAADNSDSDFYLGEWDRDIFVDYWDSITLLDNGDADVWFRKRDTLTE